ncbi:MAG: hypothetical protein POELPBGB_00177 [Bacteroidia bacterium]|nr:hypothetical protein [Bacteroidia bacterium]
MKRKNVKTYILIVFAVTFLFGCSTKRLEEAEALIKSRFTLKDISVNYNYGWSSEEGEYKKIVAELTDAKIIRDDKDGEIKLASSVAYILFDELNKNWEFETIEIIVINNNIRKSYSYSVEELIEIAPYLEEAFKFFTDIKDRKFDLLFSHINTFCGDEKDFAEILKIIIQRDSVLGNYKESIINGFYVDSLKNYKAKGVAVWGYTVYEKGFDNYKFSFIEDKSGEQVKICSMTINKE